jgi:predicted ATPase
MAIGQPSGTVTLVFTDIEGSTRLLHELGQEVYREALGEHRRVVREAFARAGGYEVDYEGDAFFYAFASAQAAVDAVTEAMRALEVGPIRIRVGIHTGEPGLDPPKYVGVDVHKAARVMSAGHGGQVLLTRATREHVDEELRDLGEHRLKDFAEPVSIFQLGEGSFPPLKTISNTNLPRPASSFVGREREVAEVVALLRGSRLVTLAGPGGTGKTRLAIEAASELVPEFKAGVFWVGLSAVRNPELVMPTVGQTLGAEGEPAASIGDREMLLLIDNLEQVIGAAPELAALVEACPNLVLLVTSRELLRVRGEVEYEVLPLADEEAVSLFSERAQLPPGPIVEELCRRLDNMPLALELAASRAKALSPRQILERLGQRLDLFRGGRDADPRQATLRATIEWSHDLLEAEEQVLFARLSVFVGGCTLEAAVEICDAGLDTLQSLVEKSLLRHAGERFWMLETIREHSSERLVESGEEDTRCRRHAAWYLALAEASRRGLRGADQVAWLARMAADEQNLRAALAWAVDRTAAETALRLVWALEVFWVRAARDDEAAQWLDGALALDCPTQPILRARALATGGVFATKTGALDLADRRFGESIPILRALGDDDGLAFALRGLAWLHEARGEAGAALAPLEESITLFSALDHPIATRLCDLGDIALAQDDRERARNSYERAVEAGEAEGDSSGQAQALASLGELAFAEGDLQLAERHARETLEIAFSPADLVLTEAICLLAEVTTGRGRPEDAARMIAATERLLGDAEPSSATREIGERLGLVAERLRSIDASALERARPESAKRPREELRAWVLGGSWTEAL